MNINSWKISSMKRIRKRKEKFIIQATMENCFACRDTWPKSTVGKLSPSIQQTSSNRKVRTLVIYKPFINETSTIDFRLISDNRIDTKPRDGEGGERERKKNDTSFTFARDFVAPRIYSPPSHSKRNSLSKSLP